MMKSMKKKTFKRIITQSSSLLSNDAKVMMVFFLYFVTLLGGVINKENDLMKFVSAHDVPTKSSESLISSSSVVEDGYSEKVGDTTKAPHGTERFHDVNSDNKKTSSMGESSSSLSSTEKFNPEDLSGLKGWYDGESFNVNEQVW
jgi:hypothetical protein